MMGEQMKIQVWLPIDTFKVKKDNNNYFIY